MRTLALSVLLALVCFMHGCTTRSTTSIPGNNSSPGKSGETTPPSITTQDPANTPPPTSTSKSDIESAIRAASEARPLDASDLVLGCVKLGQSLKEATTSCSMGKLDGEMLFLSPRLEGFALIQGDRVGAITLKATAEGASSRGIAVGDSLDRLLKAYGRPIQHVGEKLYYRSTQGTLALVVYLDPNGAIYSLSLTGTP